jgi:hypothetical protein
LSGKIRSETVATWVSASSTSMAPPALLHEAPVAGDLIARELKALKLY